MAWPSMRMQDWPPPRDGCERPTRPAEHVWQGLEAGPLYGALAVVSAILRARQTGQPSRIEVSQADAGAVWNGWRIAYEAAHQAAHQAANTAAHTEVREANAEDIRPADGPFDLNVDIGGGENAA